MSHRVSRPLKLQLPVVLQTSLDPPNAGAQPAPPSAAAQGVLAFEAPASDAQNSFVPFLRRAYKRLLAVG